MFDLAVKTISTGRGGLVQVLVIHERQHPLRNEGPEFAAVRRVDGMQVTVIGRGVNNHVRRIGWTTVNYRHRLHMQRIAHHVAGVNIVAIVIVVKHIETVHPEQQFLDFPQVVVAGILRHGHAHKVFIQTYGTRPYAVCSAVEVAPGDIGEEQPITPVGQFARSSAVSRSIIIRLIRPVTP